MATAGTITFFDDFRRPHTYTTTPTQNGWTIKDTSSGGAPTYLNGEDGAVITLASNNEVEIVTLYHNDIETFKLEDLHYIEWSAKVSGIDSNTTLVLGIATAQNDTLDSVQEAAWFRIEGGTSTANLVAETDDNTTNNDDKATGATLSSTIRRMRIDFTDLADVRFKVDGSRRASGTTFDMQAITANLHFQPFVQLQKSTGTGTPQVTLRSFEAKYSYNY